MDSTASFTGRSCFYRLLLLSSLLLFPPRLAGQDVADIYFYNHQPVNPGIASDIYREGGDFVILYRFIDHYGNPQIFQLNYPAEHTVSAINHYGIPQSMFATYDRREAALRQEIIRRGFFKTQGNVITIDRDALIEYYSYDFCRPIARNIVSALKKYGRDTRRDRIEMTMKFVQNIPYAVPNFDDNQWYYGGYIPPPMVMLCMRGDCDSKAVLFASILVHLIDANDIIFLRTNNHLLSAVAAHETHGIYMSHAGRRYYLAETAGPALFSLGQRGRYYRRGYYIEELNVSSSNLRNPIPLSTSGSIASNSRSGYSPSSYSGNGYSSSSHTTNPRYGAGNRSSRSSSGGVTGSSGSGVRNHDDFEWERRGSESMFAVNVSTFFKLGGGVSYYQGDVSGGIEEFIDSYPAYVATASFGIPLSNHHYLTFNGMAGLPDAGSVAAQQYFHTGVLIQASDLDKSVFWEAEAGLLLWRFLRASVGYGQQEIVTHATARSPEQRAQLEYYCATAGIVLNLGGFSIDLGITAFDGRDYSRMGARVHGGLSFYLW